MFGLNVSDFMGLLALYTAIGVGLSAALLAALIFSYKKNRSKRICLAAAFPIALIAALAIIIANGVLFGNSTISHILFSPTSASILLPIQGQSISGAAGLGAQYATIQYLISTMFWVGVVLAVIGSLVYS
ncbi:MAG: hypothetical protein ACREBW_06010, partial [Candidatus Micrarchaeaceae archaeon]